LARADHGKAVLAIVHVDHEWRGACLLVSVVESAPKVRIRHGGLEADRLQDQ